MTTDEKRFLRRQLISRWMQRKFKNKTSLIIHIRTQVRHSEKSIYNQSLNIYSPKG